VFRITFKTILLERRRKYDVMPMRL